jgi:hypothetical protein
VEPADAVVGNTMMFVIPLKLPPVMVGPWQVAQVTLSPNRAWLNLPPANVVIPPVAPVAGINMAGMLLTWHVSQPTLLDTGMCIGDSPATLLGVTPSKVPETTLTPWQLEQLPVMPLWLNEPLLKSVQLVVLAATWQLSQLSDPMGMWFPAGVLIG